MGLFGNLFGRKTLTTTDEDFGELVSFSTKGSRVGWLIELTFLGDHIEIMLAGDRTGLDESQKAILIKALLNERDIRAESTAALREQYQNADLPFVSIEAHFNVKGLMVRDDGFELTFQQKAEQQYFFNVHFENNKQVGVSIDG